MKVIYYVIVLTSFYFFSCQNHEDNYVLKEMGDNVLFRLDSQTKNFPKSLFLYESKEGKEYVTFQNSPQNEILFYSLDSSKLVHKIEYDTEGANGVGLMWGYYIHNMDSIFLTSKKIPEIKLTDRQGNVKRKYFYGKTKNDINLSVYCSISFLSRPAYLIDDYLFIMPSCNRYIDPNPMCAKIDLNTDIVNELPLVYPVFEGADNKMKRAGIEVYISRCFSGGDFVYSFYYDENIYVTNKEHEQFRKIPIKSQYFDHVVVPDDYGNVTLKDMCEMPNYGNILYDKYRDVYYRVAYPKTTIEDGIKPLELMDFGRKNFSIIVLDKDFNIICETLFPDYTYNSTVMFVGKDGLYISKSHYLNPEFSDDELVFSLFNLKKQG